MTHGGERLASAGLEDSTLTTRTCEAEGCARVHHAKGVCKMHYKRQDPRHKEYAKEWFARNPERTRELSRAWTERNKEKSKESHRKYYHSNKEKYEKYWARRRADKLNVHREPWNRLEIAERDNWTCQICFQAIENMPKEKYRDPMYLNIDHVVPISKGGDDAPHNLQATHSVCNKRKWVK